MFCNLKYTVDGDGDEFMRTMRRTTYQGIKQVFLCNLWLLCCLRVIIIPCASSSEKQNEEILDQKLNLLGDFLVLKGLFTLLD